MQSVQPPSQYKLVLKNCSLVPHYNCISLLTHVVVVLLLPVLLQGPDVVLREGLLLHRQSFHGVDAGGGAARSRQGLGAVRGRLVQLAEEIQQGAGVHLQEK